MTLILSVATSQIAAQACDGRVVRGSRDDVVTELATKMLFLRIADAACVISYCGDSRVGSPGDEEPTITWLLRELRAMRPSALMWPELLAGLETRTNAVLDRTPGSRLTLVSVGRRLSDGSPLRFVVSNELDEHQQQVEHRRSSATGIGTLPREVDPPERWFLYGVDGCEPAVNDELTARIGAQRNAGVFRTLSEDGLAMDLIQTIREAARTPGYEKRIGRNCVVGIVKMDGFRVVASIEGGAEFEVPPLVL